MALIDIVSLEGHIQTTYLAVYPDKLMLLDGGSRPDVSMILDYITQTLGRSIKELKVVVVTHMHPDHAGGVKLLKQKTGCLVVSSDKSYPWYKGVEGRLNHLLDISLAYFIANRQGKPIEYLWYDPVLKPDIGVGDGDSIPYFEDWQILDTPGHTDRDLSLWHRPSHRVYTADLILRIKGKFVAPYLISLPALYRASLKKIQTLAPNEILLAHGGRDKVVDDVFEQLIVATPKQPRTVLHTLKHKLKQRKRRPIRTP